MKSSMTFQARWLGQVVTFVKPCPGAPKRLRIGSFGSDGSVRLFDADSDGSYVYTTSIGQLRDALHFGVLVPDGPTPLSLAALAKRLQRYV